MPEHLTQHGPRQVKRGVQIDREDLVPVLVPHAQQQPVAREVAARGITVNAVSPGYIDAGLTGKLTDAQRARFTEHIPVGRTGRPEEVASAVAFFAAEDASYVTGQILNVDGGLVMR
jgi:enoyl-[acyl-carrier-protein] reductase (NADH)